MQDLTTGDTINKFKKLYEAVEELLKHGPDCDKISGDFEYGCNEGIEYGCRNYARECDGRNCEDCHMECRMPREYCDACPIKHLKNALN